MYEVGIELFLGEVELPVIPEVAVELVKTLRDDEVKLSQIVQLIERDPAIAATVMRHANSPAYGFLSKVTSISDAIRLLGFNNIRAVAMAKAIASAFPVGSGISSASFWEWSHACAEFSAALAKAVGVDRSMAWFAGFTVKLGGLLIAQKLPYAIVQIDAGCSDPGSRWSQQEHFVGFSEAMLFSELAKRWNFPPVLVGAYAGCGSPGDACQEAALLASVLHAGALMADARSMGYVEYLRFEKFLSPVAIFNLGVDRAELQSLYRDALKQIPLH